MHIDILPSQVDDYDPDYYDVSDEDDRLSGPLASRDDGRWDDYFDGHRKDIDYDIGGLVQNDESYSPDEGAADNSGKQPREEGEGERRGGQPPPDYDEQEEQQRSNDYDREEEEEEQGGKTNLHLLPEWALEISKSLRA